VRRLDDPLLRTVVTDGAARRLDARRQRRLADEPVAPHVVEQLVLRDDPVAVLDEIGEHAEHLWLDRHGAPALRSSNWSVSSSNAPKV
jgi:hypothetical protein